MGTKYKITYSNGFVQIKELISQDFYDFEIKTREAQRSKLELAKKQKEANQIAKEIKQLLPKCEWFTSESPICKAIHNGGFLILPEHQGGTTKIKIEKI